MPQVHYELYRRPNPKAGWILLDAFDSRDVALARAQELLAAGAAGIKVVKETYDDQTGEFRALKIFEQGAGQAGPETSEEDKPQGLPCFKPDDLYSFHARETIGRVLGDWLGRHKITATELIHRADMLEKLEATGTSYQHAIQKVAVAQAGSTQRPVVEIVKSLMELADRAIKRVYKDARANTVPDVGAGQFGAYAAKVAGDPAGPYLFATAIARHLAGTGWSDKLARVLAVLLEAPEEPKAHALVMEAVDAIVCEMLKGGAALTDLIGEQKDLGASLIAMADLLAGRAPAQARAGIAALASHFGQDHLPASKGALACRMIREIKGVRRLSSETIDVEIRTIRQLAMRVAMGIGKHLAHEDVHAAFTLRSKRLVTPEAVEELLKDAADPEERIARILFLEENLIGPENKRALGGFLKSVILAMPTENHFLSSALPPVQRMARLAALQARVHACGMPDAMKRDLGARFDALAIAIARRAKFFETLEAKRDAHERGFAVLRAVAAGLLTQGQTMAAARALLAPCAADPSFTAAYAARAMQRVDAPAASIDEAAVELCGLLQKTGIEAGVTAAA